MTGRRVASATADEILATISHSFYPTIITEGRDDVIVYRRLEDDLADSRLTIIPAGGRDVVLEIFRRRASIVAKAPVIFIADQDLWVLSGIPPEYVSNQLVFTTGYSIENDMYVDGEMAAVFEREERSKFVRDKDCYCHWFALAVQRHRIQPETAISLHPKQVLNAANYQNFLTLNAGEAFPYSLSESLKSDYARLLRGKALLSLVHLHLKDFPSRIVLKLASGRRGPNYMRILADVQAGTKLP